MLKNDSAGTFQNIYSTLRLCHFYYLISALPKFFTNIFTGSVLDTKAVFKNINLKCKCKIG